MARPVVQACLAALVAVSGAACNRSAPPPSPMAQRLVDGFEAGFVRDPVKVDPAAFPRTELKFADAGLKWTPGPGTGGVAVKDGLLVGRSTTTFPLVVIERTKGLENGDQIHSVEVRARLSAGANLSIAARGDAKPPDLAEAVAIGQRLPWLAKTPVLPGPEMRTYVITPPTPIGGPRARWLLIRPTDAEGADFAIESVRLVFRNEHLASVPSGVGWQGLGDVYRETIVARAPETVRRPLAVPSRPLLDLAIGTPETQPVTFTVTVHDGGNDHVVLRRTVTTPHRWERRTVDLARFAGRQVEVSLAASAPKSGTIAFWGAPAVRQRLAEPGKAPQVVVLMQGDTLRTDHLDAYGYERKTAPTLTRLAQEGQLFLNAITQTSWTKAATPSIHASLYPTTHGVHAIPDRLPASVTTIAEAYRAAGYATLSYSSVAFTGQLTNLHQGFEEVHEVESSIGRAGPKGAKTSREYVDRLTAWIDEHPDIPLFVYLHVFDPHSPYEPNPPYDTMWADPAQRDAYQQHLDGLKKFVADAFLAGRGMATREELVKGGVDPEAFLRFSKDWYDGSIRGMDAELARLVERLEEKGLRERSLIAFFADHGEEFHDHGRMWHGHTVYGEMIRVPLVLWGPGRIPSGGRVEETVELIDVMPTLLQATGLAVPKEAQGIPLQPLWEAPAGSRGSALAASGWAARPAIAEKQPMSKDGFPNSAQSYAIVDGKWKLIHNVVRAPGHPEFELFEFHADPRDQKNLAAENPQTVQKLARSLASWREGAERARVKPDTEAIKNMSAEQLEQLRALGYIK
jgi:arylsulfatase A-like enzyme